VTELIVAIAGALALVAGAYFTYRASKRTTSGSVSTTEAATLWEESKAIRIEAVARAERLQQEVDELRIKLHAVEDLSAQQEREIVTLRKEAEDAHRVITIMQTRLDELEKTTVKKPRTSR
jgi:hypothetical protein